MSTIITKRQFPHYHKYTMDLAGRPLTLEVGKLAELANAAVMVGYGDTRVLCCVTAAPRPRDGIDFFPLSVDFEEKMYAVGRIPGSFNRREGRPGEKGILTSRVIDRPIRPLFPYDFRNDVSVMCTVMAVDHDCSPEIAALIGTSAALAISDIPWNGPVAALKVGLVDGKLVFNPDSEQRKVSDLDVTVVSTGKKVVMIEAGANEVPNDVMFEAIKQAHEENQKQIALINQMVQEIGKPKFEYPHADFNYELFNKITADFMDEAKAAMDTDDKNVREQRWNAMIEKWHEKYLEEYPNMDQYLEEITYKFQKMIVKKWLLEGHRVDGRQKNEIIPWTPRWACCPGSTAPACSPAVRRRSCPFARWTLSPPTRSWTPSGRRPRSATCTTTTSPATPSVRPSLPAAPAAARSATVRWPSAPCCPSFLPWRSSPTPSAWSARSCPPTAPRPRAPSAAAPWPSWTPACPSRPLWPASPAA